LDALEDRYQHRPTDHAEQQQLLLQTRLGVKAGTAQPFPKGLRMIAGDSKATKPVGSLNRFACLIKGDGSWQLARRDSLPVRREAI
jgi:hypothetical protein